MTTTFTLNTPVSHEYAPNLLPPCTHFIDGAFRPISGGDKIEIIDPTTEDLITTVPAGDKTIVDSAIKAAKKAQKLWGRTTPRERSELLLNIAEIIHAHAGELEALESWNTGKPQVVAQDDIASAVDTFRFMAGSARTLTSLAGGQYAGGNTSLILREPLGVIGVITPWNYPLLMAAWKIAPALAGGNTVVLKPSEQTPLTTLKLAQLISPVLPTGVFNIVTGTGAQVGSHIASHPDISLVALTGSVRSGQAVAQAAAPSLKRVHLELGGKAPVLVLPDADLAAVAATIRRAGYWNSGQECGAACRIIVHESIAAELETELIREISSLTVGAPCGGDQIDIGPLVSHAHYERVFAFLDRAIEAGAQVLLGGHNFDSAGYWLAPTILTNVAPHSEIATSEAFGPIVSIETYTDLDEAINRANSTNYGLAASVWTSNTSEALRLPRLLDFGTVWVNEHLVLACEVPWGGFKGSGYGRDLSLYALDDFTRTKHVMYYHG